MPRKALAREPREPKIHRSITQWVYNRLESASGLKPAQVLSPCSKFSGQRVNRLGRAGLSIRREQALAADDGLAGRARDLGRRYLTDLCHSAASDGASHPRKQGGSKALKARKR